MTSIFTLKRDEVCIAWLDFHSIGHFIMGQTSFIGTFLVLLEYFPFELNLPYSLITAITFGILFEIVENGPCVKLKFDGRKDSVENSIADIFLVMIGGIFEFLLFAFAPVITNMVVNVIVTTVLLVLYLKLRLSTC